MRLKAALVVLMFVATGRADSTIAYRVTDADGKLLPCRVHLRDEAGKPAPTGELPQRVDHLSFDGERSIALPAGKYSYAIERSPEWERAAGEVMLKDGERLNVDVVLERIVDMSNQGWYAGDLHVHRNVEEIEQLMRSSDLDIAPVITWWNNQNLWKEQQVPEERLVRFDGNRYYRLMGGEDEREGGALLYFGLDRPIDITQSTREFPSPLTFVERAREQNPNVHLDIEKPFWWDVPLWLALAKPDTIGLANNHMCRAQMFESEAWGRPRDVDRVPPPRGNGFWTQEIYYHILSAGFRLPPSAGSASGVLPNPVGYNRVYVHLDGNLTWDGWWRGLRAGRSFVTNGPMLVCRANGELPGELFREEEDKPFRISLDLTLTTTGDHVPQLEVIHNGEIVETIPCGEQQTQRLNTQLTIDESGWFLVRAITNNPRTFRFASTAPYYVELGDQPRRISRESAKFFLDWVNERISRVPDKLPDADQLDDVLQHHKAAREFWRQKVTAATAR